MRILFLVICCLLSSGCLQGDVSSSVSGASPTDDCKKLEGEIAILIDEVRYCESDEECVLDTEIRLGCPFGCHFMRSRYFDDSRELSSLSQKITRFHDECLSCIYDCVTPPQPGDMACVDHLCTDSRFMDAPSLPAKGTSGKRHVSADESALEALWQANLEAAKNCDIKGHLLLVTEASQDILRPTCANMAAERKCYIGKDYTILVKGDSAILYFPPLNHRTGWPIFFAKEDGEWKIDYHTMAQGIAMRGSGCDTGWSFRNQDTIETFCSHFSEGACPQKGLNAGE